MPSSSASRPPETRAVPAPKLAERYRGIRSFSERLCAPLETEDFVVQSMPDVSPTRWHLAHTTWFFETFVLSPAKESYSPFHPDFSYLFNSYYEQVGAQFPRPRRGLLTRPTVREVMAYRAHVDEQMSRVLDDPDRTSRFHTVIDTGLHHEQQHQELMLTDIKHVFSCNPLGPQYCPPPASTDQETTTMGWRAFDEGLREIGHAGTSFCYDNERPQHRVFVPAFEIATRLVTNGEFAEFIADDGYARPELWLSDGWHTVQRESWESPLYWERRADGWWHHTLFGRCPIAAAEPVCHLSYFEADAYARWVGARLPTEAEWETATNAAESLESANCVDDGRFHPRAAVVAQPDAITQMYGDVWEWTASPYTPYPGFEPLAGALGEYNGKFMCNQHVLRGGSCATSRTHIRASYRNFFPPAARWQFSGLRLARQP